MEVLQRINFNFYNWGKHNYYNLTKLKIISIIRFFRITVYHGNAFQEKQFQVAKILETNYYNYHNFVKNFIYGGF